MKRIYAWEPWFFLFFGVFHLHRIWALADRAGYAAFWLGILESKGALYFLLMGVLALCCVAGMVTLLRNRGRNIWWRWIYLGGGGYLLFDLVAIAVGLRAWHELLRWMFDVQNPWWNVVWGGFILLGAFVFGLGLRLLHQRSHQN